MSNMIWTPGMAGPLEAFVGRLNRSIESFAERRGWEQAYVEIEFLDGATVSAHSISPEPGFGFITICPYPEDDSRPWPKPEDKTTHGAAPPEELIVPVGAIKRITLGEAEDRAQRFGFAIPPS